MKKSLSVLWLAVMLTSLVPFTASAYDFELDGIYYSIIDSSRVAVVSGNGGEGTYRGNVFIPDSVVHDGVNYTVTEIGDAFFKCTQLITVTIPPTITDLYWDAFLDAFFNRIIVRDLEAWCRINFVVDGCFGLMDPYPEVEVGTHGMESDQDMVNLVVPQAITDIHDFTFYKINTITSVVIPDQVTTVGEGAFFGCYNLKSLKIGPNVTSIKNYAFDTNSYLFDWEYNTNSSIINEVTCMATVPPVIASKHCFNKATYKHGTLYVPAQSMRAYCQDEYWGLFENIMPIPESKPGDVNDDGMINITDVTTLIDMLLNGDGQ